MVEMKMRNPKLRWINTPFIITSNSLPPILEMPVRTNNETDIAFKNRKNEHEAVKSRIKMTEVLRSHDNSSAFPYKASELAIYMHHLVQ